VFADLPSLEKLVFAVVEEGHRPAIPANCPTSLRNLISACWDADPKKRPTFKVWGKVWLLFFLFLCCVAGDTGAAGPRAGGRGGAGPRGARHVEAALLGQVGRAVGRVCQGHLLDAAGA
jgi:hypothetical protein